MCNGSKINKKKRERLFLNLFKKEKEKGDVVLFSFGQQIKST